MDRDRVPVVVSVVEPRRRDVLECWSRLGLLEVGDFQVGRRVCGIIDGWVDPDFVLRVAVLAKASLAFVEVVTLD